MAAKSKTIPSELALHRRTQWVHGNNFAIGVLHFRALLSKDLQRVQSSTSGCTKSMTILFHIMKLCFKSIDEDWLLTYDPRPIPGQTRRN